MHNTHNTRFFSVFLSIFVLFITFQVASECHANPSIEKHTVIRKSDTFDDVKIKKSLSVADLYVANCVKSLCINALSSTDANIENLTVAGPVALNKLSVKDAIVTNLSVNDEVVNSALYFADIVGGEHIGLRSPNAIAESYTLLLPATAPAERQILRTNFATPTTLEWAIAGTSIDPVTTKIVYVAKRGNDNTGNGSLDFPYATLVKAISMANEFASTTNPVAIIMAPGVYIENNNSGPLAITASGISIVGDAASSVIIMPNTPTKDLLLVNNTTQMANLTFQSNAPLATGISLTTGKLTVLNNVRIINFLIGVNCSGIPSDAYSFVSCFFVNNGIAINNNNALVECTGCTIFGVNSVLLPATNTGIFMTGSNARMIFNGGICGLCAIGYKVTDNSFGAINSTVFRRNTFDILQDGASHLILSACNFELTNGSTEIDVQVSGIGTVAEIIGCEFNGNATSGIAQGIGLKVTDNAFVDINSSGIRNYETAIVVGLSVDTSSTVVCASNVVIRDCAMDIVQGGSATLSFNACTADNTKISINNPNNVALTFFDLSKNGVLSVGSLSNQNTALLQANINTGHNPALNYKSSLYGSPAIGFENFASNPATWFVSSSQESNLIAVTTDRTKTSGLQLVSDTGSMLGGTTALRGWKINKNGSTAELSFNYGNTDIVDQVTVSEHAVLQLNGINNQLQLPTEGTQIVFAGDANLYCSNQQVLQTDGNMIIGGLTPGSVVVTDSVTNQLTSSVTSNVELTYLSGVISPIQEQINALVAAIAVLQQAIVSQ